MTVNITVLPASWMFNPEGQRLAALYDEAAAAYRKATAEALENYRVSTLSEDFALAKMNLKLCEDRIRWLDKRLKEQGEK